MQSREKILILFDGWHIAFSPTVLQLYDALSIHYDVTIFAEFAEKYVTRKLTGRNLVYYSYIKKRPSFLYNIYYALLAVKHREIRALKKNKIKYPEYNNRFKVLKGMIGTGAYKRVIAVDIKNLFYCSLLKQKVDFLSLEIGASEKLLPVIDTSVIDLVIIQSEERLDYLFKEKTFKTFYIQNAPTFKEIAVGGGKKGLLYGGTAWNPFGFYHCLNYLRKYKDETLTVQGAVPEEDRKKITKSYGDLLTEKRLVINEGYIENDELVPYFSQFEIGFCFYNFQVKWVNHFNYRSAPSGKLFKYLAAGIPVVCSDISGFRFINDFNCGILVPGLDADDIRKAVEEIRANYAAYAQHAIEAARHFSFDKAVQGYIDFIK